MIWLARHGATDDNLEPARVQGRRDVPLNELGRQQARGLAERVASLHFEALYTSPLTRAAQTAEIVGRRLGLEPIADERLAESDRGSWEGLRWSEIAARDEARYAAWRAPDELFRFPGGESLGEHQQRVTAALADIRAGAPLPALVICHGGSIRVALCHARGRGLAAFHEWDVPNGALITL